MSNTIHIKKILRVLFFSGKNFRFFFPIACVLCAASLQAQTPRPNIVIYLLDDAHEGLLEYPGTSYPAINQIRDEGIRFKDAYVTTSLCNPSRYSMYTGMFAHTHGATNNVLLPNADFPTFFSILASVGYHCAVVGKYSNTEYMNIPGMEKLCTITIIKQTSPTMYCNGVTTTFPGINTTTIIADTATSWIASLDTPFVLLVGHIGTHLPLSVVAAYSHTYDGLTSLPSNYYKYTDDYPSFMYVDSDNYSTNAPKLKADMEKHLEILQEIDRGIGNDITILESRNILDNTILVFTDDNGFLYGEHQLAGKQDPREPTSSVPLYIRYPAWFQPSIDVSDNYVALMDLCPTFLEAAGIDPSQYGFQGTSIETLLEPGHERTSVYLETIRPLSTTQPSWRGVRMMAFQYVKYHCDSLVEELFDLSTDPRENQNVINDPVYSATATTVRSLLDSLAILTTDTLSKDTTYLSCTLIDTLGLPTSIEESVNETGEVLLYPNPASDYVEIFVPGKNLESDFILIDIFDFSGRRVYHYNTSPENFKLRLDVSHLSAGIYTLHVVGDDLRFEVVR